MSDVFLSICIATFRRGAFIGETLGNLLAQATPDVEVLVLDGGSPDNTAMVVRSFSGGISRPALRSSGNEYGSGSGL